MEEVARQDTNVPLRVSDDEAVAFVERSNIFPFCYVNMSTGELDSGVVDIFSS